jgi:hypothetical protein
MALNIRVTVQGPVNRGQWRAKVERAIAAGLADGEHKLLQLAHGDVVNTLNRVLRTQTPYYRLRIRIISNRVDDSGVIYGPWLEGTGSRNAPVTRFRGYATFRKVASRIEQKKNYVTDNAIRNRLRGV